MNITIEELNNMKKKIFEENISADEKESIQKEIQEEVKKILEQFDEKKEEDDLDE